MSDPFDLERFVTAQDGRYAAALAELRAGHKRGHWMWFVLPQVAGLGSSETARRYAVSGLAEARAYLAHPVLGPRLLECARALDALPGADPVAVLGGIDAQKLLSSMTLFEAAARARGDGADTTDTADHTAHLFGRVIDHFHHGVRDASTLATLESTR